MSLPLFALVLAAFAVGTNELVIAGLLPELAGDLGVDIPTAGLLITGYALGVAVGGPLLAIPTAHVPRKARLIGFMSAFVAGNVICALAPNYAVLMAGRLVIAGSHGLFFGVAMILATQLAPPGRQSSAVSMVVAGITVANVLGAPGGTAIGNAFGWRMSFWAIAVLGVAVTVALALLIPPQAREARHARPGLAAELRPLGRQTVYLSYLMIALALTAYFCVFSYIVPLLTEVTGVATESVPWVLLALGIGGVIGNLVGGRVGDWKPMVALIVVFALTVGVYLAMLVVAGSPILMTALVFAWSLIGFSFAAPVQTRILHWSRDAPNFASTMVSTAFNVGIAAGAWLGGAALTAGWTYADLPWLGVIFVSGALAVAIASYVLERRDGAAAPSAA